MTEKYLMQKPKGPAASIAYNATTRRPKTAIALINTLFLMLAGLTVLAGMTQVPQITRAPGALMPLGDYASIESLEGGIIESIHIKDGHRVAEGDILLTLSNPQLEREAAAIGVQRAAVQQRIDGRQALLETVQASPSAAIALLEASTLDDMYAVNAELSVYYDTQQVLAASAQQQQLAVEILNDAVEFAQARSERQRSYVADQADLLDRGMILRATYLNEVRRLDDLETAASETSIRFAQASEQLGTIIAERERERLNLLQKTLAELVVLKQERAELDAILHVLEGQLNSLAIGAPFDGIVQTVAGIHVGEVMEAGNPIFELLPTDEVLIIEARVPGNSIGYIELGQPASITIDAFDVRRVGRIDGVVSWVSPIPITDERTGEIHFRTGMEISTETIGDGDFRRELQSGMTVVVEITSESRSLLSTLVGPIHATLATAFTEQ